MFVINYAFKSYEYGKIENENFRKLFIFPKGKICTNGFDLLLTFILSV